MNKRTFLKLFIHGGGLAVAGVVGIPALLTALSPVMRERRGMLWRSLGPLEEFPAGSVREAVVEVPREDRARSLREKGVYVWRPSADEVVVFSRSCTDLGCPITWNAGSQCFFCPCHGGIFARNGERMAGPPKRPLYRYANRVQNGVLEIDLNSLPPMT